METHVNYTLAGIFVISLFAAIVLGVIWLSAGLSRDKYAYYQVYMTESVSGLSVDSPVQFNGVSVGTVAKAFINRRNPKIVELILKIKADTPVTQGTRAKLAMRALTGVAYILLEDKGQDMRALHIKKDQDFPIIQTTPSVFVKLETTLTEMQASFNKLSTSIESLLNPDNLRHVNMILKNSQSTIRLLETKTIPAMNQTMSNVEGITHNLIDVSSDLKKNPSVLIRGKDMSGTLGPGEK